MSTSRREFLRTSAAVAATASLLVPGRAQAEAPRPAFSGESDHRELAVRAIDAARQAGASYADCRISSARSQNIGTRERRVTNIGDNETFGFGVRVMVEGTWGFAASSELSGDEVVRVARQAVAQARANRRAMVKPIDLAPIHHPPVPNGQWRSPARIDPFTIAIEDKAAYLLEANAAALAAGARFVNSQMFFLKDEKTFASTEGTVTQQTIMRAQPGMTVTMVSADNRDFQIRQSTDIQPRGLGYEHVLDADLKRHAARWVEEARQKLTAKPVEVGRYDLILHPTHLWLTIHEAIAHPTELDRAYGFEANYAGTSFLAPPENFLGKFRYGPDFMNVTADRSAPGSLSACGWDDEGVAPETFHIVKDGIFVDYQTTREQAMWLDWWYKSRNMPTQSHGCSYAQTWADVQFQRMPNVNLMPGERDLVWDDLIAATENGIAIVGDGSFSIDQQRYNAQFGGQLFYEVKGGKIVGMLKDVAYQIRTPEFWNAMDMIGGQRSYELGGAFGDGKGQPSQSNAVSHGCPPTRHKQVNVINTGRNA
ncbi:MAG: TldD/PmbA family protein [Gemmatimonadaceae bacterium]|nr:TldD/PmbA family protein [Gemmatimonadaceae bacterium]MCW5825871.1 TldD/PmbA family protein [Gemmatimonadaceae bacterium]